MLSSRALRLQRIVRPHSRAVHDLITIPGQRPVVSAGTPGYSAVSGHVVTVFGATSFLGRYLISKLGKIGTNVIVPYRDEDEKRHLKLMGDLGQIVPLEWDLRNEQQIAECLRHSDTVYNLVGRDYETKNFTYHDVHVAGTERIARIAAESGVSRFIQVSHLNASLDSSSAFYRTKADGEQRVLDYFPDATIVRPATMYGYEDRFLNNIAFWSVWWKLNQGQTKVRPVHVLDVAQALFNILPVSSLPGTFNLPGPTTLTYEYLISLAEAITFQKPSRAPTLPKPVALALSRAAQNVWWPILSPDEIERRYIDDSTVDGSADWAALGVTPAELETLAIKYLKRYRSAADLSRPIKLPPRDPALQHEYHQPL